MASLTSAAGRRSWAPALPGWLRRDGAPLAAFALAALALMLPVLPDPRTLVLGWPADNIQYIYVTGWMARALVQGASPLVDPHLNYPDGLHLMATDVPYVGTLAVAPITLLFGPVFGYNALIALAHLLSGYCAYLWLRAVTGSRLAGLVAGLAFMLAPYRAAHSTGHLQLVSTYPLPLFFWALDSTLRAPQRPWRAAAALVGATFLVGAASQYYLVICAVTGLAYALLALAVDERPAPEQASGALRPLRGPLLAAAAALAGALLSALPSLDVARGDGFERYDLAEMRRWSASPVNFLAPSHLHPLWGELVGRLRPETLWVEKTLYVGAAAGLLALAALVWRCSPYRRLSLAWLGTALVAAVFALGTDLHAGNLPLQPENPVWLPAYYLSQLPLVGAMRVWSRFGVVTILFVALLAGLGAALLTSGSHGRERPGEARPGGRLRGGAVAALLVGLVVLDLLPGGLGSFALGPRRVDLWLAQRPGDFAVGFVPQIDDLTNYRVLYGSLVHGKRAPALMHPRHPPAAFRRFGEAARGFPDEGSAQRLRAMGLRYLVLERAVFDGRRAFAWRTVEERLAATPSLYVVADLGDTVVVGFR